MNNKNLINMKKKYDKTIFAPQHKFQKILYRLISFGYNYETAYKIALKKCKIDNEKIRNQHQNKEKTSNSLITKISKNKTNFYNL